MLAAGLVRKSQRDGSLYDNFRDRLMFPITNPKGDVIAFGGRALSGDQEPKYLNSADSPMFHKKQVLYGQKAKEQIKDGLQLLWPKDIWMLLPLISSRLLGLLRH